MAAPERWICKRCFTSADDSIEACPNCGLARAADAPSAAAFTELEDDEPVQAEAFPIPDAIPRSVSPPPPAAQPSAAWPPSPAGAPSPGVPQPPTACQQCGSPLFAQWWNPAKGGYECRQCGSFTTGPPPAGATKARTGCFIGCAAIIGLWGILASIGGDFQGGIGLIAFAGLVGVAGLLLSRRSTG